RLYGYEVSPLLWKKIAPELSAGRVQSVAIRLIDERENARIRFKKANYWTLKAQFSKAKHGSFEAELTQCGDKRVASGRDFNPDTGILENPKAVVALNSDEAATLRDELQKQTPIVNTIENKPFSQKPQPPFVTSTLQQ